MIQVQRDINEKIGRLLKEVRNEFVETVVREAMAERPAEDLVDVSSEAQTYRRIDTEERTFWLVYSEVLGWQIKGVWEAQDAEEAVAMCADEIGMHEDDLHAMRIPVFAKDD